MDVLKQELEAAFSIQKFDGEKLDNRYVEEYRSFIQRLVGVNQGCAVLTDMAGERSFFAIGRFEEFLGLAPQDSSREILDSLDEDCIYNRIHPEDIVSKRTLELQFFNFLLGIDPDERTGYRSSCKIRMLNGNKEYRYISNQTQILKNSPNGNMWLALCLYDFSPNQSPVQGIESRIFNNHTGCIVVWPQEAKATQLSRREKQVLELIKKGLLSKEISEGLSISIHTVNRHRQNILTKLRVANSLEAVHRAHQMGLME